MAEKADGAASRIIKIECAMYRNGEGKVLMCEKDVPTYINLDQIASMTHPAKNLYVVITMQNGWSFSVKPEEMIRIAAQF